MNDCPRCYGLEPDCQVCGGTGRNVTAREDEQAERFQLLRLCACPSCDGRGKVQHHTPRGVPYSLARCDDCRGEGRTRQLIATCATPEAVGVALVTLGREGEWNECPIGVLDTLGEKGAKWIVRPWLPSARNVSDAGKLLRSQQT